jgi:signal peptidase II
VRLEHPWPADVRGIIRRWGGRGLLIAAGVGTIGCDRVTKHVATTALAGMPTRSYFGDTIRLAYAENAGGFLSLGATLPPGTRAIIFTLLTGLVLLGLIVAAVRHRWEGWPLLGLTLFVAGGASNWIDRLVRGAVVDFLNVGVGPVRTGVFNVADVAIMAGATIFIVSEFRGGGAGRDAAHGEAAGNSG